MCCGNISRLQNLGVRSNLHTTYTCSLIHVYVIALSLQFCHPCIEWQDVARLFPLPLSSCYVPSDHTHVG